MHNITINDSLVLNTSIYQFYYDGDGLLTRVRYNCDTTNKTHKVEKLITYNEDGTLDSLTVFMPKNCWMLAPGIEFNLSEVYEYDDNSKWPWRRN